MSITITKPSSGGGGGAVFPFTIVQQGSLAFGNLTSFVYTFPQAAAASGTTLFLLVACDATVTTATPSGWTKDFDQNNASFARVILFHKTSAGDTSITLTSAAQSMSVYFMEVVGAHSLDASAFGGSASTVPQLQVGAITPTTGAAVFVLIASSSAGVGPPYPPIDPLWHYIFVANGTVGSARTLYGWIWAGTSNGTSIQPPALVIANGLPSYEWATFSIK